MIVDNVDYDSLAANETLLDSFKLACAEAVAAQAGEGISATDVEVTVIDGSVIVVALIRVPDEIDVSTVSDNLVGSFDALADQVVQGVQAVPGIASVQTGEIGVRQTTTTTTTVPIMLSSNLPEGDDNIVGAGVVLIVLAVICFAGVCGGFIARMTRREPSRATPVEVFGNSPRASAAKVSEKLKLSERTEEAAQSWASSRQGTPGGTRLPSGPPAPFIGEFTGAQSGLRSAAGQPERGPSQDLMVTNCSAVNSTDNISAEGTGSTGSTDPR